MPFSNDGLDMFVSQELSKLTACHPRAVSAEFPDRATWYGEFVLRKVFNDHVPDERVSLAYAMLRRADAAVDEWDLACEATNGNLRKASAYFKALRHFETCLGQLWQGFDFGRKGLGQKLFEAGDGSSYERLNHIYNVSRHYDPAKLRAGDLHRVWLSNDGICTREHILGFEESRDLVLSLARIARGIASGPPIAAAANGAEPTSSPATS